MLMGGCFCKFVRYRIDASPFHEANCHCTMCRRTSGAAFVTWFTVPRRAFRAMSGEPRSFASSDDGTRTFCPRCGTPLTFSSRRLPDEIDVTAGSLDEPSEVRPKADIYIGTKLPWIVLDDDLPSYSGERLPSS
ncbi:MAG TPA: GFA family protein [Polyangiaceae bacterium]|nr:GFA family protein [Polyangiaceae bacterium]